MAACAAQGPAKPPLQGWGLGQWDSHSPGRGLLTCMEARVDHAQGRGSPGGGHTRGHDGVHGGHHHPLAQPHQSPGSQHSWQGPACRNHLQFGMPQMRPLAETAVGGHGHEQSLAERRRCAAGACSELHYAVVVVKVQGGAEAGRKQGWREG